MANDSHKLVFDLLEASIHQQEDKVRALARRINSRLTDEDILNPQDYEELRDNPHFNYEDGYLAALKATKISLLSQIN